MAPTPTPGQELGANREEILRFIEKHGVVDKDAGTPHRKASAGRKMNVGKHRIPQRSLDLHGMTSDQAEVAIRRALQECVDNGVTILRIVHGYGLHSGGAGPVLKRLVHQLLENVFRPVVRDFRGGAPREGGEGVTIATLRSGKRTL